VSNEHRLKQLRLKSDVINTKLVETIAQLIHAKQQLTKKHVEDLTALAKENSLPAARIEQIFLKLEKVNLRE